jgi:hypothetical protein
MYDELKTTRQRLKDTEQKCSESKTKIAHLLYENEELEKHVQKQQISSMSLEGILNAALEDMLERENKTNKLAMRFVSHFHPSPFTSPFAST